MGQGQPRLTLRYRYEDVADDGVGDKHARASTLRTVVGYRTLTWKGWSFSVEVEDVTSVGNDLYNNAGAGDLNNGVRDRPVVADPKGTEINQAHLQFDFGSSTLRLGRQEIAIGDERFVGNVGWRQNHQSFDGLTFADTSLGNWSLSYSFVDNVDRSNGSNHRMATHLFNATADAGTIGTVTLYAYLLDYDDVENLTISSQTYGAELSGGYTVSGKVSLLYELEHAEQRDFADNSSRLSAGYSHVLFGAAFKPLTLTVRFGFEELEGSENGQFNTPLSTLHKWNGWADQFLVTPVDGLRDLYLQLSGELGKIRWTAVYHDFGASEGGSSYGRELDLQLLFTTSWEQELGLKGALYEADGFSSDVVKWSIFTTYSI